MDNGVPPIPPSAGAALFRLHAIFRVACIFALTLCAFAPAQASEHSAEKKEGAVSLDVPITNLTLAVMLEDRRVVGRLDLSLQVHATDSSAVGKIEEMLPRIRDLLLTRITPTPIPGTSNLSAETLTEMKNPDKGISGCCFELIAGLKVALGLERVDLVGGNGRDDVNEGIDDGSMLGQIEGRELFDMADDGLGHVPGIQQGFIV